MDKISRIIKEEISKYIINENFSTLSQVATQLNNSLNKCGRDFGRINTNSLSNDLRKFLKDFEIYIIQIIHAVNRCVSRNSLNEAYYGYGGLSSYGINLPPELGGNLVSDFKRGFYDTKNFLSRGGGGYNAKAKGTNGINAANPNTVPSVKLSALLNNIGKWQQAYTSKNSRYGIDNMSQEPRNILQNILPSLQTEYSRLVQQQQQNQPPTP